MPEVATACLATPIGPLAVGALPAGIVAIHFVDEPGPPHPHPPACLAQALCELQEYFAGRRLVFTVPLLPGGTPFQNAVWTRLAAIPYGRTLSYRDLAAAVGRPRAVRAVGAANGRNPISIIIPCHRVIGSDGSLTGYGGGLDKKQWLLDFEASIVGGR
jgi:methylated-DNA-[protein]-cysteine S-methyltransferase